MDRRFGLPPVASTRAVEQLQKPAMAASGLRPLPAGRPGRASAAMVGIKDESPIRMLVIGDTGGVSVPGPQREVAAAMQAVSPAPGFVYHVGDVDYYNGEAAQIGPQFYEPYAHLNVPIVGIPGNHDGDALPGDVSLSTFMATFCAAKPILPAGNDEYGRDVQTQPYCDWTLQLEAATIIGVWSNVPAGGHLYPYQVAWLTSELAAAPVDRPVIVAAHHPAYSVDAHHGGSAAMGAWLDQAFAAAGRWPEVVISGHVHAYQRFSRVVDGHAVAYLVAGNGGYHNLHAFAPDAKPGLELAPGVTFEAGDDQHWGFVALSFSPTGISGVYVAVDGVAARVADEFVINRA